MHTHRSLSFSIKCFNQFALVSCALRRATRSHRFRPHHREPTTDSVGHLARKQGRNEKLWYGTVIATVHSTNPMVKAFKLCLELHQNIHTSFIMMHFFFVGSLRRVFFSSLVFFRFWGFVVLRLCCVVLWRTVRFHLHMCAMAGYELSMCPCAHK